MYNKVCILSLHLNNFQRFFQWIQAGLLAHGNFIWYKSWHNNHNNDAIHNFKWVKFLNKYHGG